MKRLIPLLLALALLLPLLPSSRAAHVSADEAFTVLETLGLLTGTEKGREPERAVTRAEALMAVLRIMGLEDAALAYEGETGFEDARGTWAERQIAYAEQIGLVRGAVPKAFRGAEDISVRDFLTLTLRTLGYRDGADYAYREVIAFSDSTGLTHGEYAADSPFLREDMALVLYTALTLPLRDGTQTLIGQLYTQGVVSYAALAATRLAGHLNAGKRVYTSAEIYERASSAVFLLKVYEDEAHFARDDARATASGFFITAEGTALMSWHALNDARVAAAYTSDGRVFRLVDILYCDVLRDIVVARISKTDENGVSVTRFPWIELGDSDAIGVGDTVYTLGAPLGLGDTFASGVISTRSRNVDDPDYPCIQFTAPISRGSSGGVLLSEYGEALGVIYATYSAGNSLNLCVPTNSVREAPLTGEGTPLTELCERWNTEKAAALLSASEEALTIKVGDKRDITVTSDAAYPLSVKYHNSDTDVLALEWGDYLHKNQVVLHITAQAAGEAEITLTFADEGYGPEDFELTVTVTVEE